MIRGILANSIMHTPTHSVSGICTLIYIIIMNKKTELCNILDHRDKMRKINYYY